MLTATLSAAMLIHISGFFDIVSSIPDPDRQRGRSDNNLDILYRTEDKHGRFPLIHT